MMVSKVTLPARLPGMVSGVTINDIDIHPSGLTLADFFVFLHPLCLNINHQSPSTDAGNEGVPRSQQACSRSLNASRRGASDPATITPCSGSIRSMHHTGVQIALGKAGDPLDEQAWASTMCDQVVRHCTRRG